MVETGLSDGVYVEITSGVSLGDTVYTVSGTESGKAAFTLDDLYQSLFGVKVVINETAGQMTGGRQLARRCGRCDPAGRFHLAGRRHTAGRIHLAGRRYPAGRRYDAAPAIQRHGEHDE